MIIHATFAEAWHKNGLYVKIHDVPATLSGRILRLQENVPSLDDHSEIIGDTVSRTTYKNPPSFELDDEVPDTERIGEAIRQLPVVSDLNSELHFSKGCLSEREVDNLLKVKGGPHLVELLRRTEESKLVFLRYLEHSSIIFFGSSIAEYRRLFIEFTDAIIFLHSNGIVHRDLAVRNLLVSNDRQHLILCDLESQYGSNFCPEIAQARDENLPESEIPYSKKSDVFCFGTTVADFILANNVRTLWQYTGNFVPPAPFDRILQVCIRRDPVDRPTMLQVRKMLESIVDPDQ
ncbi:hypothetical protein GYMLUDRAFT_165590 [Collybiopsis luxurians FD-317 M1]|uniref:Protein kinase domain-containing protein n=1 Tax=Collybiopsis luxurians FD-317 M1 TaxID=944289 RepID=A0A0D0CRI9_9AGAR|nr:hypothetical protein GYMLUDRAFT_165590 [Collybiopsis luxurians FD-317 M1]